MKHPKSRLEIGPLSNKAPAKHYMPEKVEWDTPSRVTNALMREPLTSAIWNHNNALRVGSSEAFSLRSHGAGC